VQEFFSENLLWAQTLDAFLYLFLNMINAKLVLASHTYSEYINCAWSICDL